MNHKRLLVLLSVMVLQILACHLVTSPATKAPLANNPPINVETSVAGTRAFDFAVQTAAAGQAPAPTQQVVVVTVQPPAPTVEPSPNVPMISASMDTNCRTGPSTVYEAISYLLVGKTSEVVNKYQNGAWWVIKDPNEPGKRCWVWGTTTNVTGNWQQLPEATVPPTPTAKLSISAAIVSIIPFPYTGPCPYNLNGTGTITSNMPGVVNFTWERPSGLSMGGGAINFTEPGTKSVFFSMLFHSTSVDTVRIHVTSPLDVYSDSMPYSMICLP
jgi:hypothetical protein